MDWARAIELNHPKLVRIVAELIALVELTSGTVSNLIYRTVLRTLHPAESAVRRLIVIAARGFTVKLRPSRPMPKGRVIARKAGGGRNLFKLFDTRKHFNLGPPRLEPSKPKPHAKAHPRCWTVEPDPPPGTLIPLFLRQPTVVADPAPAPKPKSKGEKRAEGLIRRLTAIKNALEDIPGEAQRMARAMARRERMPDAKVKSPLRPGPPPGKRKKPVEEIDTVLVDCHALAWEALRKDTS